MSFHLAIGLHAKNLLLLTRLCLTCYVGHTYPLRLDGSVEPANEILDQPAHERPLVAQTYSAAVAKGKKNESQVIFVVVGLR